MIKAEHLTKRYGGRIVVEDLSFTAQAGKVTGILGPNGAGKSTIIRLLFGLTKPDAGRATICGKPYRELPWPLVAGGALLEFPTWHPGRTVHDHLLSLARSQRLPASRVSAVTELVGLADVAGTRAGTLPLQLSRRLGVAAALLGDPAALVLDEPVRGLDPVEARWMRGFIRGLAAEGRAVLVASNQVSELVVTADDLVVISAGRLLADCPAPEFVVSDADESTFVRTSAPGPLAELIGDEGGRIRRRADDALLVSGIGARRIAELAAEAGLLVYELTPRRPSLDDVFTDLIADSVRPDPWPLAGEGPSA